MVAKKSEAQFLKELEEINEDIDVLSSYVNSTTKVECKCKKCGNIWNVTPTHLLTSKSGCPICRQKNKV